MSTHETIVRHDVVEPGSDRSFGLIVGGILGAIALYQYLSGSSIFVWFAAPAAALLILGAVVPKLLHPLNLAWTRLGLLLGRLITPLVMFVVYVVTIIPIGLILRLCRKDLLRLQPHPDADSYWIARDPRGPAPESLKDQF